MDPLRTGVLGLFVLLTPVSCSAETFFTHSVICYFLDGFLVVYCIVATCFLFKEKYPYPPEAAGASDKQGENGIYQELERPKDADPYEVLEPSKRKKKAGNGKQKKKKPAPPPAPAQEKDKDPYESLMSTAQAAPQTPPAPPLSPR